LVPGCLFSSQLAQQAAQHDLQLDRCEGEPVWTADGEAELHKIPFFVRGKVRRNTETFARERGLAEISAETLCDAKAHFSR
jgi:light-independent protochlorophyllide reductase subunit B